MTAPRESGRKRGFPRTPLVERFWPKVDKRGPDECWNWIGGLLATGYGAISHDLGDPPPIVRAHRVSWEFAFGPIPEGLWVLHRCDNRKCVNPSHLFLGTNTDNMRDCISKGRFVQGEIHPGAKLTVAGVREIRDRVGAGELQRMIAADFGVSQSRISQVASRRIWKHVP